MPLTVGKHLGSYEILALIGVGGMGEVYRARDLRLDRIVAIKVLPDHVANDVVLRERFEREAKAISSLNHPNICTLYDVGREAGAEFLVMEYLEGETAAQRLAKGPIPLQQVLRYGVEIAEALDRAHRQGVVHRDLKPGNVMLTKTGAKLLDFGLAKLKPISLESGSEPTAANLTGSGTILGTLQYMAPEQVEGGAVDYRADIFAFGTIVYEMATGKKAFDGRSQASLIGAILRDEPQPISALQPVSPPALDELIAICLAKDPDERWQSAADVGRQLRLMQGSSQTRLSAASAVHESRAAARLRKERAVWLTASVVAVFAVTFAAFHFRAAQETPETRVEIVTPATHDPFSFAISPDGRSLVVAADGEKGSELWLRSLGSASAQPLSGTDGATYPFWSANSRSIGFFAAGKLKRVDVAGGPPRVLADAREGRGATWSSEDVIVFAPEPGAPLQRVSGSGGDVTTVRTTVGGRFPQFLPGGRRFIFLGLGIGTLGGSNGIYLGSLDSEETHLVTAAETSGRFMPPDWLLYISGTTLVARRFDSARGQLIGDASVFADPVGRDSNVFASAFSVSTTGVVAYRANARSLRQLTWFDRSGRASGVVGAPDESDLLEVELSPDESRVAEVRLVRSIRSVWLVDNGRGVLTRSTDDRAPALNPVWQPDGKQIAYASDRSEAPGIYALNLSDGSEELLIPRRGPSEFPTDWSPDGRFLLFTRSGSDTSSDLWILPLDGDKQPRVVVNSRYREDSGQFSPDGRWVAYRSEETGRSEIYVQAFPGPGPKLQVSTRGGTEPRWRPDGGELFYISLDADMMAATFEWSDGMPKIGTATALFRTRKVRGGAPVYVSQQYDVARDGRFLINVNADESVTSPISLILNWKAAEQ